MLSKNLRLPLNVFNYCYCCCFSLLFFIYIYLLKQKLRLINNFSIFFFTKTIKINWHTDIMLNNFNRKYLIFCLWFLKVTPGRLNLQLCAITCEGRIQIFIDSLLSTSLILIEELSVLLRRV